MKRLGELGIVSPPEDEALLASMIQGAKRYLLAQTGQVELPMEAMPVVLDMAAGEYLLWRNSKGDLEGFDAELAVRQISQGDTSITYAKANEEGSPIETLAKRLLNPPAAVIHSWRRLRW